MRRGGGRTRAAEGLREEEDGAREENEKAEACLFIRKRCEQTCAKIKGEPIMVIRLYRRLDSQETLMIKDPLEDDVMKVFCVSKR